MTGKTSPLRPHCRVTPAARTSEIVGYPFTAISKSIPFVDSTYGIQIWYSSLVL
jgi:hypothetical protein